MKRSAAIIIIFIIGLFGPASYAGDEIAVLEKSFLEGKYEKAVLVAQDLIDSRSRQRYEVYYLKGLSEMKLNRFADARASFQDIIDKYPRTSRVFDARVGIGDSYLLEGKKDNAIRIYKEIMEKFPEDKNIAIVKSRLDKNAVNTEIAQEKTVVQARDIPRGESGGFTSIQVGSFKNSRNAEKLSQKLSSQGFESFVEIPANSGDKLYRVKVGRLQSAQSAEALASRLRVKGYKTKICPAQ